MKFFLLFFIVMMSVLISGQNIKVTYIVNGSGYTDKIEEVYLNNGYKVSITDSLVLKKYNKPVNGVEVIDKSKSFRKVVIDDTKNNNLFFTYAFNNENLLVRDVIPDIKWKIHPNETKKIGKYTCKKATTSFRGTDLEAYFTTEIPVSLAPHKLSGLPGLVMEMRSFGLIYYEWTVKDIIYPYYGKINYSPSYIKSLKLIDVKKLVERIDQKIEDEFSIEQSKLKMPPGVKVIDVKVERINPRNMLEKKFEWEK